MQRMLGVAPRIRALSAIMKSAPAITCSRLPHTRMVFELREASAVRSFATIGAEGSDSDFAPKKAIATKNRDVAAEIKQGTPDFPMCGFSNRAVQILDQHKATYGAFNVLEDAEVREGVKKFSNWPTIPQLYVNGEFVGGCDIMMELNASGELKKLLAEAGAVPK